MAIFSTPQENRPGWLQDYAPSQGDVFEASLKAGIEQNPTTKLIEYGEMSAAGRRGPPIPVKDVEDMAAKENIVLPRIPENTTAAQARLMIDRQKRIRSYSEIQSSGDMPGTSFVGGVLAGFADPLNAAIAFAPVIGSARYVSLIGESEAAREAAMGMSAIDWGAQALGATSPVSRVAAKTVLGSFEAGTQAAIAEGAVGHWTSQSLQDDYNTMDSLSNIATTGIFGGMLHGAGAAFHEVFNSYRPTTPRTQEIHNLPPETRTRVLAKAVTQLVSDSPINVGQDIEQATHQAVREAYTVMERSGGAARTIADHIARYTDFSHEVDHITNSDALTYANPESKVSFRPANGVFDMDLLKQIDPKIHDQVLALTAQRETPFHYDPKAQEAVKSLELLKKINRTLENADKNGLTGEEFKHWSDYKSELEGKVKEFGSKDPRMELLKNPTPENVSAVLDRLYSAERDRVRGINNKLDSLDSELMNYTDKGAVDRAFSDNPRPESPLTSPNELDPKIREYMASEETKASAAKSIEDSIGKVREKIVEDELGNKTTSFGSEALDIAKAKLETVREIAKANGVSIPSEEALGRVTEEADKISKGIEAYANCIGRGGQ